MISLLSSECECSRCDARGEAQAFDDLLPLLLVDDLHEASSGHHQVVQLVQVKYLLGHNWQTVDGSSPLLHERKQLVKELLPLGVIINLVELQCHSEN